MLKKLMPRNIIQILSKESLLTTLSKLLDFQQRIWIVSIHHERYSDTFVVNEDSFAEPMQWMRRKGYSEAMLQRIERLQRSQTVQFNLDNSCHQLLRVK
jgi:hypothetical protein